MSKMAEENTDNFVVLNAKVFPIPKEFNKANIEDIFKILQAQERPELVEEMKKMVILSGKDCISINKVLPAEMLEKILGMLDIESLVKARLTCKRWKLIIDNCDIMEKALSKILKSNRLKDFAGSKYVYMNFSHFQKRSLA